MAKILLLDSNSLLNRAFFALPPLMNSKGEVTNAVFGYLSMLAKLLKETAATHVAAVFDVHHKTFRHEMYEEYKAGRRPAMPEMIAQFPMLKEVLKVMDIKILEMAGFEADDIIGTLAKRFENETIIISGDKDVLQLVDDTTTVYHTKRGVSEIIIYNTKTMEEEGLTPSQVIEYKALAGDSSDNIPGAKGIGEKTAKQLLKDYIDVDGVYAHIDELKGKLKENLIESKPKVDLSKILATINVNVPIKCSLEDLKIRPFSQGFKEKLLQLEMKNLVSRFEYEENSAPQVLQEINVLSESVDAEKTKILLKNLSKNDIIAIDSGDPIRFSFDGTKEYTAVEAKTLFDYTDGDSYGEIYAMLMRAKQKKLLFSAKQEMRRLKDSGAELSENYEDLQLMSYLLSSTSVPQTAQELAERRGYHGDFTAAYLHRVYFDFITEMKEKGVDRLYKEVELPLVPVLFDMEKTGFQVDIEVLSALGAKYTEELKALTVEIYAIAGTDSFNINSPQQLGTILFDKLQLPHAKKTQKGYSVSADVLEKLDHPIVSLLLRYRTIQKLNSTYIEGMRLVMDKKTNKVHTVFKQALTTTGRLSSTEPNLQNIPVREVEGREIRKMFIASPGNMLVAADYSQIELRLLAHFAGDETLVEAYRNAKDIHSETAAKIFQKSVADVTKDERAAAKTVNFSIIYGISNFGLSERLNISQKKTKEFIDKYFETYPSVKSYMQSNVKFAEDHGYGVTLLNRIRWFPELRSSNYSLREFGKRAAMNMPLQGTASDIIKVAMLRVSGALKAAGLNAKLILQVHDELIIDTPLDEVGRASSLLKDCMEGAVTLRVPLVAEVSVGKNWFEAK